MKGSEPVSLHNALRRQIRRAGFDVVRWPMHTTRDGHLRWLLRRLAVTTVLDVGANRGQFGQQLRTAVRFEGRIISFEPDPGSAAVLRSHAGADPLWDVHAVAIGDVDGRAVLHRFAADDWNSLHDIDDEQLAQSGRSIDRLEPTECDVRRLDSLWTELVRPQDRVFLKSDAQGHDLAVVQGASTHLSRVEGIVLEASVHPFYSEEPDLPEMLKTLQRLGFRASGFFPVVRSPTGTLDTIDVCFVNVGAPGR